MEIPEVDPDEYLEKLRREASTFGELTTDDLIKIAYQDGYIAALRFFARTTRDMIAQRNIRDPTPWCTACGAMQQQKCYCGPIAKNN